MTKTECVCEKWFVRDPDSDFELKKHNGSSYTVRVWTARINETKFALHCDNYYGNAILWANGTRVGNVEPNYDILEQTLEYWAR